MNLKPTNRLYWTPLFCRDLCYYLIWKRCYRSENCTMPLKTSIHTEIYSRIARYSLARLSCLLAYFLYSSCVVNEVFVGCIDIWYWKTHLLLTCGLMMEQWVTFCWWTKTLMFKLVWKRQVFAMVFSLVTCQGLVTSLISFCLFFLI